MTEDNKKILFVDLCSRIRYGVLVDGGSEYGVCTLVGFEYYVFLAETSYQLEVGLECPKPYLRPMSSMTEEEEKEFKNSCKIIGFYKDGEFACTPDGYDWLNKHHFDYRGLIPMGLALEAIEGMYENV